MIKVDEQLALLRRGADEIIQEDELRERIASAAGVSPAKFDEMARNRQKIIETLVERNISDITQVTRVVQNYYHKLAG